MNVSVNGIEKEVDSALALERSLFQGLYFLKKKDGHMSVALKWPYPFSNVNIPGEEVWSQRPPGSSGMATGSV